MRRAAWAGIGAALLGAGPATRAAPPSTLDPRFCAAGERVLFGCMAGAKAVSLCARGKAVQYRYGAPGRSELIFPETAGGTGLTVASTGYSGGGESQVSFARAGVRYVVYSRTVRTNFGPGGNDPKFTAGVAVMRNGRQIAHRRCTSPEDATLDQAAAERLLPLGEFVQLAD